MDIHEYPSNHHDFSYSIPDQGRVRQELLKYRTNLGNPDYTSQILWGIGTRLDMLFLNDVACILASQSPFVMVPSLLTEGMKLKGKTSILPNIPFEYPFYAIIVHKTNLADEMIRNGLTDELIIRILDTSAGVLRNLPDSESARQAVSRWS